MCLLSIQIKKEVLCMNNFNERNSFRKVLSLGNSEISSDAKFRKDISLRLSSPIKDNSKLERIPGHDIEIV